jgi:glycosyltransferase involved in cell wall biosynthesis
MTTSIALSICIPTLNRGHYIGETLDSISRQLTDHVEVVIVDGGSTDATAEVVRSYASRYRQIRYVSSPLSGDAPSNQGFDRDCNLAVEHARGTYCWLMTDDDLLVEDAIVEVLSRMAQGPDLMLACARVCSIDFDQTLEPARPCIAADRTYDRSSWNDFAAQFAPQLTFLGSVIVKRSIWLSRERARYYGSGFVHVGVILSEPLASVAAIARPLVIIRYGNALWRSRAFDIWMVHWPSLVWSFSSLPDAAKAAVTPRHPYKSVRQLLWYRALGAYTIEQYRQRLASEPELMYRLVASCIARIPVEITNALYGLYLAPRKRRPFALQLYELVHCGHAGILTRGVARLRGIR